MVSMSEKTKINAKVAVINDRREILLIRRKRDDDRRPGEWDWAGGQMNPGETPLHTAKREVREETGLEICEYDLKELGTWIKFKSDGRTVISHLYALAVSGHPELTLTEHDAEIWVPRPDFPQYGMSEKYQKALEYNSPTIERMTQTAVRELVSVS